MFSTRTVVRLYSYMFQNWASVVLSRVRELFICETLEETKCYDVHPELFEEEEILVHVEIEWTNF